MFKRPATNVVVVYIIYVHNRYINQQVRLLLFVLSKWYAGGYYLSTSYI